MTRRIVVLSDGTGNSAAKAVKTNVWRMFQALDQSRPEQRAYYDDGVGTSANKYLAALGGAFGWGLKRNVLQMYLFVCRNWEPGTEIFAFGFSRGAFTIRVLVDLIAKMGLVTGQTQAEWERNAAAAYRQYRYSEFPSRSPLVNVMRWLRGRALALRDFSRGYPRWASLAGRIHQQGRHQVPIRFLGLWDTVEAYGVPIVELKKGISRVMWPMVFGDLLLSPAVQQACHALSLDDQRTTFHPLLWDESSEPPRDPADPLARRRITQVWFSGVHANVGGGYPEDQLSQVSLEWIMGEAMAAGLALNPLAVEDVRASASPYARLYDSRAGLAAYYRYGPRRVDMSCSADSRPERLSRPIRPIVHWSVVMRMAAGTDRYAPLNLPADFDVLAPDGRVLPLPQACSEGAQAPVTKGSEASPAATPAATAATDRLLEAMERLGRPDAQAVELSWDTVFWRRASYLVTVLLTALLAAFPWVGEHVTHLVNAWLSFNLFGTQTVSPDDLANANTGAGAIVAPLLESAGGLIPGYVMPWVNAARRYPLLMSGVGAVLFMSLVIGGWLDRHLRDRAWAAWQPEPQRTEFVRALLAGHAGWVRLCMQMVGVLLVAGAAGSWLGWKPGLVRSLFVGAALVALYLALEWLAWRTRARATGPLQLPGPVGLRVARMARTSRWMDRLFTPLVGHVLPIVLAVGLLVAGAAGTHKLAYEVASAWGTMCEPTEATQLVAVRAPDAAGAGPNNGSIFETRQACWSSGQRVEVGRRYRITLDATEGDWFDRQFRADPAGLASPGWAHALGLPLRRHWGAGWFEPIVRIGHIGGAEMPLRASPPKAPVAYAAGCTPVAAGGSFDPVDDAAASKAMACAPTPPGNRIVSMEFQAPASGEVFVYVNDAWPMLPGLTALFYGNNRGTAKITLEGAKP